MSHRFIASMGALAVMIAVALLAPGTHRRPGEIVYGEHDDRSKVLDGATYSGWPAGPAGNMVERYPYPLGTTP